MIRIFDERETDFSHDGIEILDDITISCISEREINGTWFLNAEFLRDEDKSTSIENRRILKVPTAINEQLFRIVSMKVTKSKIMVYAEHIFFDNRYNFIADTYVVQKDGNNALQQMIGACQYKNNFRGLSTIPTIASTRLVRKTFIDAIMGDSDNSFINRWGGEIELDNFDFKIKSEIGENRGVEVTYGHNMQGFEGEIDESGVITRVMPEGFNGILLPEKYVDSPLIDNYAFPRIQKIYISSIKVKENPEDEDGFDTEEEAHEALRQYVANLYAIENIDKPSVNIRVNFINLEKTDQFKNEVFEKVYLGDTLKVNLEKYGFDVTSRVISERYDNRNDRFVEIELGHSKVNVLKEVSNVQQTIDGILEQLKQQNSWEGLLDQARDEATKLIQEGIKNSFVVARKNEILIMDSENVETAKSVIRMNKNGIGFSQTGYNGPYIIGITIDGKINADCITSGIINAALIRAGRLQSLNNKTWISMEDGSFSLAGGKITFDDVNGLKIWLSNNEESDLETSLNNYKQQVSNDIKQLTDKVNNIDSNIGGAFVDGIIDTVEKNIIEDSLLKLDKEKKDVDSRYQNVYNNVNLLDPFKTNLYTEYNNFVSKYNTLVSTINTIIEDNVATAEEKVEYKTAMNNYNTVIPQLTVAFDEAISSIGEKITTEQINDLNDLLKQDIKNVSDSLGSLENTMNNSFRDGIINEAEYTAILESLKRLDTEKLDIDKNYNNLYSDINLSSTIKTNLKNKYDSYVSSHNNLTNYINNTIGDRVATEEEKAQIKILLNAYNVALSDYGVAQTQAINDIANNSANKMLESYKQLVNKDISDINQKINDIKDDVGGAIADGIIEEAETLIIQNSIDQLDREKEDLDQRYQEIYNNNHLSSTTKELLATRYLNYNTAHTNLINQINTMIQDKVATETEKIDYKTKLQTYNSSLSLVSRCFDTAINEIAQNNLNSVTEKLKKELQGNIDDVSNIANELNRNFGNYTADGILTESEKTSIRTYLNTLSAEKSDIDNQYKATYENTDLTGVPKTNLLGAYNSYVTAYNNLVSYINTLLSKTTIVENDRTTLNTRFSEHDSYLSKYSTAINNAIDAISQKKKQDAIDSSKDYYDTQITIDKNGILSTVSKTYSTKQEVGNLNTELSNKIQESINNLEIDLQDQIDGKIETWSQPDDPSTAWTTTELKTKHKGDLWYNTSNAQTKRWSATAWELQPEAETLAKEKKRIFTETPTIPYDKGDLWILPSNSSHSAGKQGEILTCTTARSSGSYNSADWQKKIVYTDDTYVKNLESSIRQTVDSVELSVNSMKKTIGDDLIPTELWLSTTNWSREGNNSQNIKFFISRSSTLSYLNVYTISGTNTEGAMAAYIARDCIQNADYTFKIEIFSCKKSNGAIIETPYNIQIQGFDGTSWTTLHKISGRTSATSSNRITKNATVKSGNYAKLRLWVGRDDNEPFDIGICNISLAVIGTIATQASIKVLSDKIQSCVTKDQMGTMIEQNAASVRIAWNNCSQYVQFEGGSIAIYDSAVTDSKKRAVFDQNGIHFWRDSYYLGKMGTNYFRNNEALKGIVFDLEYQGACMTWSARRSPSEIDYMVKWCYASKNLNGITADRLHAFCDLDLNHYTLRNVQFEGGGVSGTLNFVQVKSINGDGTVNQWYNGAQMVFQNGILISGTWGD